MNTPARKHTGTRPPVKRRHVMVDLRQQIVSGQYKPGDILPTQEDLSRTFRVSKPTVQLAIQRLAQDGFLITRGRNGTAVAPHPPHLAHYGMVFVQPPSHLNVSRFLLALRREAENLSHASPRKINCYFSVDAHDDSEDFHRLRVDLAEHRLAGLIFPWVPPAGICDLIRENKAPAVIYGVAPRSGCSTLSVDMTSFIRRALDEFAAKGRRRVAALVISEAGTGMAQLITDEARQRGMTCPSEWVQAVDAIYTSWASPLVRILMKGPADERPDALLITDDNLAEHATAGLVATGLSVPRDLMVIAHCNTPMPPVCHVPVVRLGFDVRQILQTSMELIDRHVAGNPAEPMTLVEATFLPTGENDSVSSTMRADRSMRLVEAGELR